MGKSEHKHKPCFTFINTARLNIKQGIIIQLTDSCSMTAFYIICINLKLRLGIHLCIIGKKDIIVFLVSQCTLGIRPYKYPAVESTG